MAISFVYVFMHGREEWVLVQVGSQNKHVERPVRPCFQTIFPFLVTMISSKIMSPILKYDILIHLNNIVAQMCDLVLSVNFSLQEEGENLCKNRKVKRLSNAYLLCYANCITIRYMICFPPESHPMVLDPGSYLNVLVPFFRCAVFSKR